MSGTQNTWKLRLSTEGADQVVRDLRAAATESAAAARAYDTLIKAQPQLATGAERSEQALRKNVDAMRSMRGELNLASAATQGLASSMGSLGAALTSPTAAIAALGAASGAGVVQIARLGDEYTNTMNRLRAATGSVQAAGAVYAELVAMSQQTGASISESAGAFVRFSVAARAIGATNGEVLQLTRTIQQAGLISGASTQEAAAGVQQLGQALASGRLQGDELRSIMENMPTLAEALAREMGVSIGRLREMGTEGKLTSDVVFAAMLRAGEGINRQFTELTPTMGRAFGILGQAMVEFVGKLDQALGLSQRIAQAATAAAGAVRGMSGAITPRSPGEQAQFELAEAERRRANLEAEIERLRSGAPVPARRGTISRGLQETAAGQQTNEARLAELQASLQQEIRMTEAAQLRLVTITEEGALAQFSEQAQANERREQAARTAATASFNTVRDALDKERQARTQHAERIAAIDAGLANGATTTTEADRLRTLANNELAEALRERGGAAGRAAATDSDLASVGQAVVDMERDRAALMREGETLTASVRTEAEKYADTLANLNNLLASGAITQDTYNRAVAAADPAVKAAAEASRRIEQENTRTTDRITSFFGDAFARAFEGTGNGFRGLMASFRRAAISTFASIAAQAIIRPIVAPIVQGLGLGQIGGLGGWRGGGGLNLGSVFGGQVQAATPGGGGGGGLSDMGSSFGTLRQAYNGLTSPGGLGSFFPGGSAVNTGFGGLDGALNSALYTPGTAGSAFTGSGFAAGTALPGEAGAFIGGGGGASSLSFAQALGPLAAIGGGAYGVYSGLQRGGIGGYTSAAGGAVSAVTGIGMLGSAAGLLPALGVLGPIGLGIGAVLAIAGALLPGAKPSGMGQLARTNLNTGMQTTEGLGGKRFSQANATAAGSTVEGIVRLAREVGDKLGGARIGGDVAVGVTNGDIYLQVHGQKTRAANTEQGAKDIAAAAARMVLNEFNSQGTVQGPYRGIVAASGDSLERLYANLQWYEQVYKAFDETAKAADVVAIAIKGVEDKFNPLIDKAHELGLSSDNLVKARQREWDAAVKAAQAMDKARKDELAALNSTVRARLSAANGAADYEARLLVGQVNRASAWANELRALEQRLASLGETSEGVASAVGILTQAQSAEFARNVTTWIADLDANVRGRILRATGRTDEADRLDFEAGATAQIKGLRDALAELGLTAEQAAGKIAETQQAIDAERAALQKRIADEAMVRQQAGAGNALGTVTSLRDYARSLTATNAGAGTAIDRLGASQRQFDAIFGAASAGDANSVAGLRDAAETFRLNAREVFGGGQGFADALRLIEQRITAVSDLGPDALTQSFMAENARANTDRIVDALADLKRENAALRADLNMLMMRPAA